MTPIRTISSIKCSLLKKYDIPISHLDFDYIKSCKNSKEIERILKILYSGEEGYFPDLIVCTENKLKELKSNSKWLRTENQILNKNQLNENEQKDIYESFNIWFDEMKIKDKFLSTISEPNKEHNGKNDNDNLDDNLPPIRGKDIKINSNEKMKLSKNSQTEKTIKSNSKRINYIDYSKWNKYDADTEILKIDLEEEKIKEENERKFNQKSVQFKNISTETNEDINEWMDWKNLQKLTNVEKENLTIKFKEVGNDYYRAGEYENAIREYTKTIKIFPSPIGYSNRAIAFFKLGKYLECIDDCDSCLAIDPRNIKALFRKGQALEKLNKKKKAYEIYSKIVSLEPQNTTAKKILNSLKNEFNNPSAPSSASASSSSSSSLSPKLNKKRIQIIEAPSSSFTKLSNNMPKTIQNTISPSNKNRNNTTSIKSSSSMKINSSNHLVSNNCCSNGSCINKLSKSHIISDKNDTEDLSKLIIPNRIVKSSVEKALQKIEAIKKRTESEKFSINSSKNNPYLELNLLPIDYIKNNQKNNNFIEEI